MSVIIGLHIIIPTNVSSKINNYSLREALKNTLNLGPRYNLTLGGQRADGHSP